MLKIILVLIMSFTFINASPTDIIITDNYGIDGDDLQYIRTKSIESVHLVSHFLTGKKSPDLERIDIIIDTREKFQQDLEIEISKNTLGFAIPKFKTVYLIYPFKNISSYPFNSLGTLIYHEIFHILIDHHLNGNFLPLWLNEGLAMYISREFKGHGTVKLATASVFNNLIPLSELRSGFPSGSRRELAYIQSFDAVNYLIDTRGETSIQLLLDRIGKRQSFDAAFFKIYKKTPLTFYKEWEEHVYKQFNVFTLLFQSNFIWAFFAVLVIIIFPIKKIINRRKLKKWEQDEQSSLEID